MDTPAKVLLGCLAGVAVVLVCRKPEAATLALNDPNRPFTAEAPVQVGDVVTVALVSTEPTDSETSLTANDATPPPLSIPPKDLEVMTLLDQMASSGGTAKFKVTATGLIAPGGTAKGQSITIGVLHEPSLSFRLPVGFLTASIRQVERNGRIL